MSVWWYDGNNDGNDENIISVWWYDGNNNSNNSMDCRSVEILYGESIKSICVIILLLPSQATAE